MNMLLILTLLLDLVCFFKQTPFSHVPHYSLVLLLVPAKHSVNRPNDQKTFPFGLPVSFHFSPLSFPFRCSLFNALIPLPFFPFLHFLSSIGISREKMERKENGENFIREIANQPIFIIIPHPSIHPFISHHPTHHYIFSRSKLSLCSLPWLLGWREGRASLWPNAKFLIGQPMGGGKRVEAVVVAMAIKFIHCGRDFICTGSRGMQVKPTLNPF